MKKYVVIIVSCILLILGFLKFRRKKQGTEYIEEIKKQKEVLKARTLSDIQVKAIVSKLYFDLLENNTEDEQDAIAQILQIKNLGDWLNVVSVFGVRKDNAWSKSFEGTLPQAITEYLHGNDLKAIKEHLASVNVVL